jgi:glycosyltransferase involved in cell wall biosynthesis
VAPDEPTALARAVEAVLEDPRDYGKRGRERAQAEFSVARMAERTTGVYERAVNAPS